MKAVILARVSTEMQQDGFSLDAQLDRLRNYCSIKGLEIAKEFTVVESSFHGKRTKFYEVVNYIKRQSKLTALVVDTVDRVQRTFNEFPMLLELVKREKLSPRNCLTNAQKCGLENSNELQNIPKNPTFSEDWFAANTADVCFRHTPRRISMSICDTPT